MAYQWVENRHPRHEFSLWLLELRAQWPGVWFEDVCQVTRRVKRWCRKGQTKGDKRLTLNGFRYLGLDGKWWHNVTLFKAVDTDEYQVEECSCGTQHRATMKVIDEQTVELTTDVLPSMTTVGGFTVARRQS